MLTWPWISFRMTHLILFCVAIRTISIHPRSQWLLLLTFFLWEITRFRHAAVIAAVTFPDDVRHWLCKIEMRWAKGKSLGNKIFCAFPSILLEIRKTHILFPWQQMNQVMMTKVVVECQ